MRAKMFGTPQSAKNFHVSASRRLDMVLGRRVQELFDGSTRWLGNAVHFTLHWKGAKVEELATRALYPTVKDHLCPASPNTRAV